MSPLSINIPESIAASPWVSLARTIIGSVTDIFWVSIVVVVPVTVKFPVTVRFPLSRVPSVEIFSVPKCIPLPSAVIVLFDILILPSFEFVAAVIVPLVVKLLVPNEILSDKLVIEPSSIVTSPNLDPLAAVTVEVEFIVPVTDTLPVDTLPDVLIELSINEIALEVSVIFPSSTVTVPILEPEAAVIVELKLPVPVTETAPEVIEPDISALLLRVNEPLIIAFPPNSVKPSLIQTALLLVNVILLSDKGAPST